MLLKFKVLYYYRLIVNNVWPITNSRVVKYLNCIKYKFLQKGAIVNNDIVSPVFVNFIVTKRCNLSCDFCIVREMFSSEPIWEYDLDINMAREILSHPIVDKALFIMFTGGEPLLNEGIFEIIRLAKAKGHIVGITTNGLLLMDNLERIKDAGVDIVNISVYENNYFYLKKYLGLVCKELPCRVFKMLTKSALRDIGHLENVIKLAKNAGCLEVLFQNMIPFSGQNGDEVIYADDIDYLKAKAYFGRKYGNGFIPIYFPDGLRKNVLSREDKRCRMPWYFLSVDAIGNIGFCCRYQSGSYGNLFEDDIECLRNTKDWVEVRRGILAEGEEVSDKCKDCYLLTDAYFSDV